MRHPLLSRRRVAAAVAGLALAAAGCGADPDRDAAQSSPPASPAKAEFLERGNKLLCAKSRRVTDAVVSQVLGGRDLSAQEEVALAKNKVLPALHTAYDGLAALPAPPGDGPAVAALLASMRAALGSADRDPALVLGGRDPFTRVDRKLAGYGLDGCA